MPSLDSIPSWMKDRVSDYPERFCLYCGAKLKPKVYRQVSAQRYKQRLKVEWIGRFEKRKFCNQSCGALSQHGAPRGTSLAVRALQLLREYDGLPLTMLDLVDELSASRDMLWRTLKKLHDRGEIRKYRDPFDPRTNLYSYIRKGTE